MLAQAFCINTASRHLVKFGFEFLINLDRVVGFASGKNLKVTLTYDAFTSKDADTTIPFLIQLGWAVNGSTSYADINSNDSIIFKGKDTGDISKFTEVRSKTGSQYYDADRTLVAVSSTDWGKALAGDYSATITFTAEVVSG